MNPFSNMLTDIIAGRASFGFHKVTVLHFLSEGRCSFNEMKILSEGGNCDAVSECSF